MDGLLGRINGAAWLTIVRVLSYLFRSERRSCRLKGHRKDPTPEHPLNNCSSSAYRVGPVHRNSNKSALLPPPPAELQKLAGLRPNLRAVPGIVTDVPRTLRRRLDPAVIAEITAKYRDGATTPALCAEYSVSKGGLLKLLRDEGVQLRCQPLTAEQIEQASKMYLGGTSLAAIATHLDVSYNGVRQALIRAGVERRPRGDSYR